MRQPGCGSRCEVQEGSERLEAVCGELLGRIQKDEGGRGIGHFLGPNPIGDLSTASARLCEVAVQGARVCILTGFPCCLAHSPPTETDGPPAAVALARVLEALGAEVVILTDSCNERPMRAAAGASSSSLSRLPPLAIEAFPPGAQWGKEEEARLRKLSQGLLAAIAIERPGPSASGSYLTMRGHSMDHLVAPLERIFDLAKISEPSRFFSVAVGDGGNELGMGKVYESILESGSKPLAASACIIPADYLVVASVSNWGGYALAAGICWQADRPELLLTADDEEVILCALVGQGCARDGVTGLMQMTVDGLSLSISSNVLSDMRTIVGKNAGADCHK